MENVTTPEQYELLEMAKISGFIGRAKGLGRPTNKDRRSLDEFTSDMPEFFGDFDFDFDDDLEEEEIDEAEEEETEED
jgi:ribosome-associated heat shock protein Hsp15